MRNVSKFLVMMVVMAVLMMPMCAFASAGADGTTWAGTDVISSMESQTAPSTSNLSEAGGKIYKLIQNVGIIVAVIVTVAFGIQWIVATPAKKAELKGKMWNLVIGIAILLLASVIIGQLGQFIEGLNLSL